jgi:hypothetical protein
MHGGLDAHAAEIAIYAAILDAQTTLIDQVTRVSELFTAELVERLSGEIRDQARRQRRTGSDLVVSHR